MAQKEPRKWRGSVNRANSAGSETRKNPENPKNGGGGKIHENKNADVSQWLCIAKVFFKVYLPLAGSDIIKPVQFYKVKKFVSEKREKKPTTKK